MDIPKSFKLMGTTINIEIVDDLGYDSGNIGLAKLDKSKILLEKNNVSKDVKEHTFIHELTHFILYYMGEKELEANEKFVEVFSGLLHQALTTMEF